MRHLHHHQDCGRYLIQSGKASRMTCGIYQMSQSLCLAVGACWLYTRLYLLKGAHLLDKERRGVLRDDVKCTLHLRNSNGDWGGQSDQRFDSLDTHTLVRDWSAPNLDHQTQHTGHHAPMIHITATLSIVGLRWYIFGACISCLFPTPEVSVTSSDQQVIRCIRRTRLLYSACEKTRPSAWISCAFSCSSAQSFKSLQ